MKFINPKIFIISLCIGLLLSYVTTPNAQVIYVYPNPDNIREIQYKDDNDSCFTFETMEEPCPKDTSLIREYPVQNKYKE